MTAVFFGMFALFYVNASFLQYGKGFSVLLTGLGIIPLTVPVIAGTRQAGRLARRIGLDATIALAFAFVGCGLLGLSASGTRTPYVVYAAWLVVTGTGVTLACPRCPARSRARCGRPRPWLRRAAPTRSSPRSSRALTPGCGWSA
jgi:predicted MFS family arabinose efflux permease